MSERFEQWLEQWKEMQAERFQEFKGHGAAMLREAAEDIRGAVMAEYAGGPSAMGTPLHPTPSMVTESIEGTYEDKLAAVHGQSMQGPEMDGVGVQAPAAMEAGVQAADVQQPEAQQPEVKQPEMEM